MVKSQMFLYCSYNVPSSAHSLCLSTVFVHPHPTDIVHENLKIGSDGESDQASGTSSDEVQSPTGVCLRNRVHRRISMEVGHHGSRMQACAALFMAHTQSSFSHHFPFVWDPG